MDRRNFGQALVEVASAAAAGSGNEQPSNAQVFSTRPCIGDQELRVGTVEQS
jgi:hypothetical protein